MAEVEEEVDGEIHPMLASEEMEVMEAEWPGRGEARNHWRGGEGRRGKVSFDFSLVLLL